MLVMLWLMGSYQDRSALIWVQWYPITWPQCNFFDVQGASMLNLWLNVIYLVINSVYIVCGFWCFCGNLHHCDHWCEFFIYDVIVSPIILFIDHQYCIYINTVCVYHPWFILHPVILFRVISAWNSIFVLPYTHYFEFNIIRIVSRIEMVCKLISDGTEWTVLEHRDCNMEVICC